MEYFAGLGETVDGDDGGMCVIEYEGVARHLGDEGMKALAGCIVKEL